MVFGLTASALSAKEAPPFLRLCKKYAIADRPAALSAVVHDLEIFLCTYDPA